MPAPKKIILIYNNFQYIVHKNGLARTDGMIFRRAQDGVWSDKQGAVVASGLNFQLETAYQALND